MKHDKPLYSLINVEGVKKRIRNGETYAQIAKDIGVEQKTLSAYMIRHGFRARDINPHRADSNNIMQLRKQKGLTAAELGRRVGVSREAVRQHERNFKQPSPSNAEIYARVLGVDTIYPKGGA